MNGGTGAGKTAAAAAVMVAVTRAEVFRLLADIEQLPRWAPGSFYEIEVGRDGWVAYTPWGDLKLELRADEVTGFVYLEIRTGREVRGLLAFWIVAGAAGSARVRLMSLLEREGFRPDAMLEAMYGSLRSELAELGRFLGASWREPPGRDGLAESAA
jgi:hypothetical protein